MTSLELFVQARPLIKIALGWPFLTRSHALTRGSVRPVKLIEKKGKFMKSRSLRIFLMLTLLLAVAAVSVMAQTPGTKVTIIPFSFNVGEKTLPAGEYTVARYRRDSEVVWLVESRDGREKVLTNTNPLRAYETESKAKLVFRRYGNRYVLSQIWTPGNSGRELRRPKFTSELAKNNVEPQTVVIAIGADVR